MSSLGLTQQSLLGPRPSLGPGIIIRPGIEEKLRILTEDAKYDLAGSCAKDAKGRGRRRGPNHRWLYPVILPQGGHITLFRTLLSNVCVNDCAYCALRSDQDPKRVSLSPEEVVKIFLVYLRKGWVQGIFLSSGVSGSPDATMERLIQVAKILRKRERYRGYIHLKVIPGASPAAIEEAANLADAVSLNIEAPGAQRFRRLSLRKRYLEDIIKPLELLAQLKRKALVQGRRLSHTTQFVVGAAGESDQEILRYVEGLYQRLGLNRVYFSAYQPGAGPEDLPGETLAKKTDLLTREHRFYQVDFLLRKYGFSAGEIPLEKGFLPLDKDPKEAWAQAHPEFFPVNVNKAPERALLRVPGLGPTLVKRIIKLRRQARLKSLEGLTPQKGFVEKARPYVCF